MGLWLNPGQSGTYSPSRNFQIHIRRFIVKYNMALHIFRCIRIHMNMVYSLNNNPTCSTWDYLSSYHSRLQWRHHEVETDCVLKYMVIRYFYICLFFLAKSLISNPHMPMCVVLFTPYVTKLRHLQHVMRWIPYGDLRSAM